tara:strand:+ start:487 stop:837 length:351 start_codon:yes stop_codon:yes gene_type:complete
MKSNKVKQEIGFIHITSDGKKFIDKDDACLHEQTIIKEEEIAMELVEIIKKVLNRHGWGVVLKNSPIIPIPMQDEAQQMFKINLVESDRLFSAIQEELEKENSKCLNEEQNQMTKS